MEKRQELMDSTQEGTAKKYGRKITYNAMNQNRKLDVSGKFLKSYWDYHKKSED